MAQEVLEEKEQELLLLNEHIKEKEVEKDDKKKEVRPIYKYPFNLLILIGFWLTLLFLLIIKLPL